MLADLRKEKIRRELAQNGILSVHELTKRLKISPSTVRRDLIELEEEGEILRTLGGARYGQHTLVLDADARTRAVHNIEQKERIGAKAAAMVMDAGCLILDAGTTTLEVARHLNPTKSLRVITDSIEIAYELRNRENVSVLVTGGILNSDAYNLYGGFAEQMLRSMHAQVCVMGAIGVTAKEGLTKHDIEALPIRHRMVEISRQLICVADSSKFGVTGLVSVCDIDRLNTIITDEGISTDLKKTFESLGVSVIIA